MRRREFIWCINYESDTMEVESNETNATNTTAADLKEWMRKQQERIDFYATYDVMTGVRIAATLGGFFGLMVILVMYKSKSKTERALEDPNLAAAAVAEAEEEERQIAAALEATAYEQLNPQQIKRSRRSLDTSSVSPRWIRNTKRFSSIAGYASLMDPPIRLSSKLPCSIDEDSPTDDGRVLYDDIYTSCYETHLGVNIPNRRASNVTCSSSGSSYLERRGSSVMLGLPPMPSHKHQHLQQMRRRQSSPLPEQYDFYYPIDIRVIQPTPGGSPCGSERALYDTVPYQRQHLTPRLAPLASISSCNSSLANDCTDYDMQSHVSYCSDSVFHDIECYEDTDDEIDPFSTDSEEDDAEKLQRQLQPCCSQDYHRRVSMGKPTSPLSTISDESTSTLIGVCCAGTSGKDCERCQRCLRDVGYVDDDVEEEDEQEHSSNVKLCAEGRLSRRTSASSITREMSTSATLGALGSTLETLERKRGSCCSIEGVPSPTGSAVNSPTVQPKQVPQIEVVDVDNEGDTDGVWTKETLF